MNMKQIIADACRGVGSEASARDKTHFEHVLGACALLGGVSKSTSTGMVTLAMHVWSGGLPYAAISFGVCQLGQEKFKELLESKGWYFWGQLDGGFCGAMPSQKLTELSRVGYLTSNEG